MYVSATKPIIAGPINIEQRPIDTKLLTVVERFSVDWLTACLMTNGTKFAVRKPYKSKEIRCTCWITIVASVTIISYVFHESRSGKYWSGMDMP